MTTPAYPFQATLGIDTANPTTVGFTFIRESLVCDEEFPDAAGIRGTRSRAGEQVRAGQRRIHGQIEMEPNAVELSGLLHWIMGGSTSGSGTITYALGETLQTRNVQIDRVTKVPLYDHCLITKATFSSQQDGWLKVVLDIVGVDETIGAGGSWAHPTLDTANGPWRHTDTSAGITINGTSNITCRSFELVIDNMVDADRYFNSQTLSTATNARDRKITCSFGVPYGDWSALYAMGVAGVAATIVYTNGSAVFTIPLNNWKVPRKSPQVQNREEEIMLPLVGEVYRTGTTLEFGAGVTLNVGP